jgi:dipeptidyl aminopeptidase/acylaminoacyl peptidase
VSGNAEVNITSIEMDDDGNLISYTYSDEVPHTVYKEKFWQDIFAMLEPTFPNQYITVESYSKDKKKFIVKTTSPTNPGIYYLFDLDTKQLALVGDAYPDLDKDKLSDMKPVSYQARDGLEIPAYLSVPKGKEQKNTDDYYATWRAICTRLLGI